MLYVNLRYVSTFSPKQRPTKKNVVFIDEITVFDSNHGRFGKIPIRCLICFHKCKMRYVLGSHERWLVLKGGIPENIDEFILVLPRQSQSQWCLMFHLYSQEQISLSIQYRTCIEEWFPASLKNKM